MSPLLPKPTSNSNVCYSQGFEPSLSLATIGKSAFIVWYSHTPAHALKMVAHIILYACSFTNFLEINAKNVKAYISQKWYNQTLYNHTL